jgi:hypothetical protein
MLEYPIYNMESKQQEFQICGYKFIKAKGYENKIKKMHCLSQDSFSTSGKLIKTREAKAGKHQLTFTAFWDDSISPEPTSKLYLDSKLLTDILLLYSIWSNRNVCTSKDLLYKLHPYYNEESYVPDYNLHKAITIALKNITDKADAKKKKVFPSLFLLHESNSIREWQIKLSLLSTSIDIISKSIKCKVQDMYSTEEIKKVKVLKQKINELISEEKSQHSNNVLENVLTPFLSNVNNMGSLNSTDQLIKWAANVLEIKKEEEELRIALHDHCIAYNKFRNSVIHYAGLPKNEVKIRISKTTTIKFSEDINEKSCNLIGAYYYWVFKDIYLLWLGKILGTENIPSRKSVANVRRFLESGKWYGQFIFEGQSTIQSN